MIEKIEEALQQGYKNLGMPKPVIDGLAALGETVVKDESEIAAFVQGDAVKGVMKSIQSETDKIRTVYSTKLKALEDEKAELETKLNGNQPNPDAKPTEPQRVDVDALFERLTAAIDAKLNPLQEELAGFKAAKAKEDAVSALDNFVNGWDYAGGFPQERDLAKRVAMKVYKAGGEKMSGDELIAAFREEFEPAVKNKGVTDFPKPFKSDGGGSAEIDFSQDMKDLQEMGLIAKENGTK